MTNRETTADARPRPDERVFRVAILQKLYPNGIPVHAYGEALYRLEIAEQLHGAVIETEAEMSAHRRRPVPRMKRAEPAPKEDVTREVEAAAEDEETPTPVHDAAPGVLAAPPTPDLLGRGAKQVLAAIEEAGKKGVRVNGIMRKVKLGRAYINQCITELRQAGYLIDHIKGSRPRRYRYAPQPIGEVAPVAPGIQ